MIIGNLILKLGIEAENIEALKQFEQGADKSEKAAEGAAQASNKMAASTNRVTFSVKEAAKALQKYKWHIAGVATAFTGLSIYGSRAALDLRRFELNTGMSAQKLQEWQQKAALSGVAAEEVASSLSSLQQKVAEIEMGKGDVSPFAQMGIGVSKDAFKQIEMIRSALDRMPVARGTMFAQQLGLSPDMIAFLREMKNTGPTDPTLILTEEELQRLKEFNVYFNRVWDDLKQSAKKIGGVLAPIAREVLWVGDRFRKAFISVSGVIGKLLPDIERFRVPLLALGLALTAAFSKPTALITMFALALEDLFTFMRGGDSLLGRIIGYFSDWRRIVQDLIIGFAAVLSGMYDIRAIGWSDEEKAERGKDWGEAFMDKITANNPNWGMGYADAKIATMKDGKITTLDQSRGGNTVNQNITVNGAKSPEVTAKTINEYTNKAVFIGPLSERGATK